jgi:hypothetical protein
LIAKEALSNAEIYTKVAKRLYFNTNKFTIASLVSLVGSLVSAWARVRFPPGADFILME